MRKFREHLGEDCTLEALKEKQLRSSEKMGDKPGTVWQMYDDLKTAGFTHIDCLYKLQILAFIVAEK